MCPCFSGFSVSVRASSSALSSITAADKRKASSVPRVLTSGVVCQAYGYTLLHPDNCIDFGVM